MGDDDAALPYPAQTTFQELGPSQITAETLSSQAFLNPQLHPVQVLRNLSMVSSAMLYALTRQEAPRATGIWTRTSIKY